MLSCGNFYIYLLNGSLYNNSLVYDSSNRLPKPIGPFCFNSFKLKYRHMFIETDNENKIQFVKNKIRDLTLNQRRELVEKKFNTIIKNGERN
jgi:hypothetical protein